MVDRVSPESRSANMARIRGKDSVPEMRVRKAVFGMGYRYRLHRRDLPGSPDLVFVGSRKIIFVHGCFWHRHAKCKLAAMPKTRPDFWAEKFKKNVARDRSALEKLSKLGWRSLVIWECETQDPAKLEVILQEFLN